MVIKNIAVQSLPLICSLNNINAMKAVATISKLPKSETVAGLEFSRPYMNSIGAAISKATIPITYGKSLFAMWVSVFLHLQRLELS